MSYSKTYIRTTVMDETLLSIAKVMDEYSRKKDGYISAVLANRIVDRYNEKALRCNFPYYVDLFVREDILDAFNCGDKIEGLWTKVNIESFMCEVAKRWVKRE